VELFQNDAAPQKLTMQLIWMVKLHISVQYLTFFVLVD
jgi:hypothetical protein